MAILCAAHAAFAQEPGKDVAAQLIQAIKAGDKAAVAGMIQYPLQRLQPLTPIRNQSEFVERYEDFFDAVTISQLKQSEGDIWSSVRGTAIGGGLVWISGEKVIAINLETTRQKSAARVAREKEASQLHSTARTYDRVLFACTTRGFQIRIHDDAGKVRYFSWRVGQALSTKPDLILNGEMILNGNGGNAAYTFKNGDFRYEVQDNTKVCGEVCEARLIVMQGAKTLLDQTCMSDVK